MNLKEYLRSHLLFLDGGTGTLLQQRGLQPGESPERWNVTHPEIIADVAKQYFDAGCNVVCTNTFGANRLKFSSEELKALVSAAVANAKKGRELSSASQQTFIALDVGPLGKLLKPYGTLDFEEAVSIFAETVRVGAACGVDLIFIETMNDCYETKAALLGAKEACDLPVFVSNAYGEDGRLLSGTEPEAMVALLEGMGADAVGANCSLGPKQLKPIVKRILAAASVPVILKPNAGLPRTENGKTVFDVTPEEFADDVADLLSQGVRIAGGCCGTTPEYLRKLTEKGRELSPLPLTKKHFCRISSFGKTVSFDGKPILIGERINPTGKKRFKQALIEGDTDYILREGIRQQEAGVSVLDVNVGIPEIDEADRLPKAVCALQTVTDLPLQIDTANPVAMEKALRRYNGKALINSVNGKEESMQAVFPLQKKYGGVAIALTLDENGIPDTAEGRIAIAEKILSRAAEYGIERDQIIFDPLALTVSADNKAAKVTLKTVEMLSDMGCKTSLGISNVSYGLPDRDTINGVFFACALERGLSAAICNPYSEEILKTYYAFCALHGEDPNCADYLQFCGTRQETAPKAPKTETDDLKTAICKGLTDRAAALTARELETKEGWQIVAEQIVPALDEVGKGFETNTLYLPQLLMSAEAAKSAFEQINRRLTATGGPQKGPVVLATVEGDIHDIGKNILRLMLENYGFAVIDLGKNVPPSTVLAAAKEHNASLVALSALMTTTVPAMEATIRLLRRELPACKVMVGGAVLTADYAKAIGADGYAKDAMEAVRCAESLLK